MNKPDSIILKTVARSSFFAINVFAIYLLLRGHDYPGGGFIAGLTSAVSLVLLSRAMEIEEMHRIIRVDPVRVAGVGLLIAGVTGLAPMFFGRLFLEQFDTYARLPLLGQVHLSTTLAFDAGVFLVVIGVTVKFIFVLAYSTLGRREIMLSEREAYSSTLEQPIEEEGVSEQLRRHEAVEAPGGDHAG